MRNKLLLPVLSHAHIKGLVSGFGLRGVEMAKKVAGVVRASRGDAGCGGEEEKGCGGDGEVVSISDTGYNLLFRLRPRIPCDGEHFRERWQQYRRKV